VAQPAAVVVAPAAPLAPTTPSPAILPPGVAPSAVPSPTAAARGSATKTIFGVPAPSLPQGFTTVAETAAPVSAEPAAPEASTSESETGRTDRITKTGARKVAVPAPEIVAAPGPAAPAAAKDVGRTTQFGFDSGAMAAMKKSSSKDKEKDKSEDRVERVDRAEKADKTAPVRAPAARPKPRQAPIWTYVGVGFTFGLVLLGIYQLVGRLAH
jgi:hypothetical protein